MFLNIPDLQSPDPTGTPCGDHVVWGVLQELVQAEVAQPEVVQRDVAQLEVAQRHPEVAQRTLPNVVQWDMQDVLPLSRSPGHSYS